MFKRFKDPIIDEDAVKTAYRRWAPVYDNTFGRFASEGRKHAVEIINQSKGRVLEVGVGTGLSLPAYKRQLEIVGIDLSPEMLEKARERVSTERLRNVAGLHEMDAGDLKFPDAAFDTVVAMYVMTVVPDPEKVMRELSRVCRPGGEVMLVNHFSARRGHARLGGAPHGSVRGHAGVAPRFRRRARARVRRPHLDGEARPASLGPLHDDALPQGPAGQGRRVSGVAGADRRQARLACLDSAPRRSLYPPSPLARAPAPMAE